MSHDCHCQTGKRTLALVVPNLASRYADLIEFGGRAKWAVDVARERVDVPISGCGQFTDAPEVLNFLRTILDAARLADVRAMWLAPFATPDEQARLAREAQPIETMASVPASPLLSMLREGRIDTHFQPIFRSNDALDLWGYECLMRGTDADGTRRSPAEIIGWARQEQLIFMLDRVCRETHLINAGTRGIPAHAKLLINFMPTSIYQPEFCLKTTMAAAQRGNIEPSRVIFEVVESENVADRAHLTRILDYYRAHGYGVALDDLGSGYAGLSLLGDLSPDLIKIDRELVVKAAASPMHRSICAGLVRIGQENGKLVLAEGVERVEEMHVMRAIGVDLFQGYLFGKPAAEPAVQALAGARERAVPIAA